MSGFVTLCVILFAFWAAGDFMKGNFSDKATGGVIYFWLFIVVFILLPLATCSA
jgi:hypothetical protein